MKTWFVTCGGINIDNVVTASRECFPCQVGGNAVYSAVSASLWADCVAVVGNVPRNYPQDLLDSLGSMGINTASVRTQSSSVTLYEWFLYNSDGSRRDRVYLPSEMPLLWLEQKEEGEQLTNEEFCELSRLLQPCSECDNETFTSFRARHPIYPTQLAIPVDRIAGCHLAPSQLEVHEEFIDHFKTRRPYVITLDPGTYLQNIEQARLVKLLNGIDVFMPSEKEVNWLFPNVNLIEAIKRLADISSCSIIVKCGGKGSLLWDGQERRLYEIGPYVTEAKEPTGAGDTYCGSFLVNYALTGDLVRAAVRASATASCVVEAPGIKGVSRDRISEILRRSELISHRIMQ